MTDYTKLVKALRVCNRIDHVGNCNECYYGSPDAPPPKQYVNGCKRSMCEDAADAIEDLQAEVNRLELDNEDYEHEQRRLKGEIEALQAQLPKRGEIVRCRECKWSLSCGYISTRSYAEWKDWFCADGERKVQE